MERQGFVYSRKLLIQMALLILHIGSHKTGTSALQSAFAINAARLAERNIFYPGGDADARHGKITSGNGLRLASFLNRRLPFRFHHENSLRVFGRAAAKADGKNILYSSEFLEALEAERLKELLSGDAFHAYRGRIIYFVRSIAGHAISSYSQAVKREQVTASFSDYLRSHYRNPFRNTIEQAEAAVGPDNVLVLNYDAVRQNLLPTFLRTALKIDPSGFESPPTINRSLTAAEIDVMRAVNAQVGDRRRTVQISDALIYADPDAKTGFVITPEELGILAELHAADLDFINARLAQPICLCDPSIRQGGRPTLAPNDLDKAVREALNLVPEVQDTTEPGG